MPKTKSSSSHHISSGNISSDSSDRMANPDSEDYRLKRDRNNIAVKKSREKSRQRAKETAERMARLRRENDELEQRTVELARELRTLKDVLLARAGGGSGARRKGASTVNASEAARKDASGTSVPADPRTVDIDHEYGSSGK